MTHLPTNSQKSLLKTNQVHCSSTQDSPVAFQYIYNEIPIPHQDLQGSTWPSPEYFYDFIPCHSLPFSLWSNFMGLLVSEAILTWEGFSLLFPLRICCSTFPRHSYRCTFSFGSLFKYRFFTKAFLNSPIQSKASSCTHLCIFSIQLAYFVFFIHLLSGFLLLHLFA